MSFLTFSVLIDSMLNDETAKRWDGIHLQSKLHRIFMHLGALSLFIFSFFIPSCNVELFPHAFNLVAAYTLINALFIIYLYYVWNEHPENFLFNRYAAMQNYTLKGKLL